MSQWHMTYKITFTALKLNISPVIIYKSKLKSVQKGYYFTTNFILDH